MGGLSQTGLVLVVVAACIVAAVIYAFKDKFPLLRHLPEIGWLPCLCYRADYMDGGRRRRQQTQQQTQMAPATAAHIPTAAPVATAAPVPDAQVIDKA